MSTSAKLVCVGLGMDLQAHLTPRARSYLQQADIVFAAERERPFADELRIFSSNVRSLRAVYEQHSVVEVCFEIADVVLSELRAGKSVCAAFLGRTGSASEMQHALRAAATEGYPVHIEPGISAEDCLLADLGIDPNRYGCQHYETRQLILYRRSLDSSAYLILWQTALALCHVNRIEYWQLLIDVLAEDYPLDHKIIIYTQGMVSGQEARVETIELRFLGRLNIAAHMTIVVPPAADLLPFPTMRERLKALSRPEG